MWLLPPSKVGAYAEQDALMTLKLWERLHQEIEKQDLWNIWKLETSLIPTMLDMRTNGVRWIRQSRSDRQVTKAKR